MNKKQKMNKILWNIYRDVYACSNPSISFDTLYRQSRLDDKGNKIIPCNEYEIEGELLDDIVKYHLLQYGIDNKMKTEIMLQVYLGYIPKIKTHE